MKRSRVHNTMHDIQRVFNGVDAADIEKKDIRCLLF